MLAFQGKKDYTLLDSMLIKKNLKKKKSLESGMVGMYLIPALRKSEAGE